MDPAPDDHVVFRDEGDQFTKFIWIKLTISVGQQNVLQPRGANPRAHRLAVTAIYPVMNHSHMAIFGRQTLRNRARAVAAAIVDYDDFVELGEPGQRGKVTAHHALDVGFLVMRRQKNA